MCVSFASCAGHAADDSNRAAIASYLNNHPSDSRSLILYLKIRISVPLKQVREPFPTMRPSTNALWATVALVVSGISTVSAQSLEEVLSKQANLTTFRELVKVREENNNSWLHAQISNAPASAGPGPRHVSLARCMHNKQLTIGPRCLGELAMWTPYLVEPHSILSVIVTDDFRCRTTQTSSRSCPNPASR